MPFPQLNPLSPDAMDAGTPLLSFAAWWALFVTLGCALAFGRLVVPRLRRWRGGDLWLLRAIAGFVPLGMFALLVGRFEAGLFSSFWLIGLSGWFLFLGSIAWQRARCGAPTIARKQCCDRVATVGWVVVGLWLAIMLAPALAPSAAYDVLEYHLALPAQIAREGRLAPIPHVFYSAQPVLTEIVFALGAVLEKNAWGGAPGLAGWMLFVLATLAFARLAALLEWPAAWRPWLWLLLLSHPIIFTLQLDRFTDWTGALMLLAGLWVAVNRNPENSIYRTMLLGILAAGAVGAKWTNAGTVAVPLAALAIMQPAQGRFERIKNAGVFGACALIFFAPWALWLWHVQGNPFAPFLAQWFPAPDWPAARLEFLLHTHGRLSPVAGEYWANLGTRMAVGLGGAPLVLLGLLAGAAHSAISLARRRRGALDASLLPIGALTLSLLAGVLLWGQLRHAAARFLAPSQLLALVLLVHFLAAVVRWEAEIRAAKGAGASRLSAMLGAALALLALAVAIHPATLAVRSAFPVAAGWITKREYLRQALGSITAGMFEAANRLPADSRVLAIDEARGYYFNGNVTLATVFDEHPIAPLVRASANADNLKDRLGAIGFTHVLINEFESARLLAFHPPAGLESDSVFQRFREQYLAGDGDLRAEAERRLAQDYQGWSAFAAMPLSDDERKIFIELIGELRARTTWRHSIGNQDYPAIWIAPIE